MSPIPGIWVMSGAIVWLGDLLGDLLGGSFGDGRANGSRYQSASLTVRSNRGLRPVGVTGRSASTCSRDARSAALSVVTVP